VSTLKQRAKAFYEEHVVENSTAQNRLLKTWNSVRRNAAWIRSLGKAVTVPDSNPQNIYHASVQKTGSHWVKSVFSDPRIRTYTRLATYPGHRYEWDEFHKRFPRYHFVPGLFISYGSYEEIEKPDRYKTFYVIRDPRDIVVSWYFSIRDTHRLAGKVGQYRERLRSLDREEGISFCIRTLAYKFAFMRTWAYNADDPNVLMVKFENLVREPVQHWGKIFDHCGIEIPSTELRSVLGDYDKEGMRKREQKRSFLRKRSASNRSHYRKGGRNWEDLFTEKHRAMFAEINGNLLSVLGYDE